MKKIKVLMITLAACSMLLAGCGHEHDFAEATCTKPATCKICGDTEGDPLGHDYSEATCTEPATCKRCGKQKGEAGEHEFGEANYQEAATCSICGETEGEPLTPAFEEHGLYINCELDEYYPYLTDTYEGHGTTTVGDAHFNDFEIAEEMDGLPAKDGYVWEKIHASVEYSDDNALADGYYTGFCREDYYDIELRDDSSVDQDFPEGFEGFTNGKDDDYIQYETYEINYYGEDVEVEAVVFYDLDNGWRYDDEAHAGYTYYFHVPEGYDGVVVGFYHRLYDKEWGPGEYIYDNADEDSLFFRLDPALAD